MFQAKFSSRRAIHACLLIGVAALLVWLWRSGSPLPDQADAQRSADVNAQAPAPHARTVSEAWRWDAFPRERAAAEEVGAGRSASPFSVAAIHAALRKVELDEHGRVVIDDNALAALRSAFATLDATLTHAQLDELQQVIRAGLPGEGGRQAAKIVRDYHDYHVALRSFEQEFAPPDGLDASGVHYEQLVALRHEHLGYDTAEKLFAREQAHARYTMDSMRVQSASGLSQAQRDEMQRQLKAALPAGVLPGNPTGGDLEWKHRIDQFQHERRLILDAGLADEDAQEQIDRLMSVHFSPDEIELVRDDAPDPSS